MLTDWLIVRRLAAELEKALRGARIRQAGVLPDGRFALRAGPGTLILDPFGQTPIATLDGMRDLRDVPGWVRAFDATLDGLRIERVRARRGDRLIAIDCVARSRFGVESGARLVAELVPRFGNLVLLKGETVVAAAKEFEAGGGTTRTIVAGAPYVPPPLPSADPSAPALDDEVGSLVSGQGAEAARERASRALRAELPLVPRLVADSLVAELSRVPWPSAAALGDTLRAAARRLLDATLGEPDGLGDVFVYRDGERIVQFHVVPLHQFARLEERREPALLPLVGNAIGAEAERRATHSFEARRTALAARIEKRRASLARERDALERERDDAIARTRLRTWGELLYAHLADVPPQATHFVPPSAPDVTIELDPALDAKANAQAIFKRYKKAVAKREHVERRLEAFALDERFAAELAWEAERAEPETLADVVESVDRLERRKAPRTAVTPAKRRTLEVSLGPDARVLVGRSPQSNAELTFRTARPDDLWFHARATPGAHVVLRLDGKRAPGEDELRAAAALAAYYSKARDAENVPVDYTERKHVRKQRGAAPGLVWYVNARTLVVAPRSAPQ